RDIADPDEMHAARAVLRLLRPELDRRTRQRTDRQGRHHSGRGPGHAPQHSILHTDLHTYGRRKSAPHTSSAPKWPATATSAAAQNNARRYSHSRLGGRSMSAVARAAATAATAPAPPSQRCHSRAGDASTMRDEARIHPAPAEATANAAPARMFATATRCHSGNWVVSETSSATAAISTSAIGKCTSRG